MCSHESDWRQRVSTWDEWYYWSMKYGVWASYQQRVVSVLGWMVLRLQGSASGRWFFIMLLDHIPGELGVHGSPSTEETLVEYTGGL